MVSFLWVRFVLNELIEGFCKGENRYEISDGRQKFLTSSKADTSA